MQHPLSTEQRHAFAAIASERFLALAHALLGAGQWERPKHWGQPLVIFPTGAWDVPHRHWHLDLPAGALDPLPALRAFVVVMGHYNAGGASSHAALAMTLLRPSDLAS